MKKNSFIFGALVGAVVAAGLHVLWFHFHVHRPPPGPPDPARMESMLIHRFEDELSLTPEQMKVVTPILSNLHLKMLEAKVSEKKGMDAAFVEATGEIKKVLEPEQQPKLDELIGHFQDSRKREEDFLREHRGNGQLPPHEGFEPAPHD